jgi:hypothetical protein
VGEGTRLAAATGAWICFEDESGQGLQPPKARTWGRRGHTPVVRVSGRGSGRLSVAALVCVKAGQPGRFSYRMQGHRLRLGNLAPGHHPPASSPPRCATNWTASSDGPPSSPDSPARPDLLSTPSHPSGRAG